MSRNTHESPRPRQPGSASNKPTKNTGGQATNANPEDFGKSTSPRRERMAKEIKETSPEERIEKGR